MMCHSVYGLLHSPKWPRIKSMNASFITVQQLLLYHLSWLRDMLLTHLGNEKEILLYQLLPSCVQSRPRGGVSSEPLLSLSLDGARVASESPVTVKIESERLGLSSCASGAKLSWTICLALWQTGAWIAGVSVGRSKVRTVWVLEVSSSSLSRLLYDVPLAR